MSTQREEVVVDPHAVHVQDLLPDLRQPALRFVSRRHVLDLQFRPLLGAPGTPGRGRQGLAVHLPAGGQGHRLQGHEGGGNHEIGQSRPQELAQGVGRRGLHGRPLAGRGTK